MSELVFSQFEAVVRTAVNPEIEKQFEESQTLYNRFHKGKAIQVNQRGYRIPFYDRPPASDSFFSEGGAMPVADNPQFNRWTRLVAILSKKILSDRLGCCDANRAEGLDKTMLCMV